MTDDALSKAEKNLKLALREYLSAVGEDVGREGIAETPDRFVRQMKEALRGYADDPQRHLKVFNSDGFRDLVMVKNIAFGSVCEHHILPFYGSADIGYLPTGRILGLSKFARVIDSIAARMQVQERMTKELADALQEGLQPRLLLVRVSAKHLCMSARGVKQPCSSTDTLLIRGDVENSKHYVDYFNVAIKGSNQ